MSYWQVCPLGLTGYGDSPYQCFSAFAGNSYLIDLESLIECGLADPGDLETLGGLPSDRVNCGRLYTRYWPVLDRIYRNFVKMGLPSLPECGTYEDFKKEKAPWLQPYSCFMALKDRLRGRAWYEWPLEYRTYSRASEHTFDKALADSVEAHQFFQYLFFCQWDLLKGFARKREIEIIGDIPLYVALDSADVWANPEIFQLGDNGMPHAVAGVPPDYFSSTGQLWGNPLFDWKELEARTFDWWLRRIEANLELFDIVRLDHFRGFESYWKIPAGALNAAAGEWDSGPGLGLFATLRRRFPYARLIAEDLGKITPPVKELLAQTGLPGMAVLQFAFEGDAKNSYLPHNLQPNSIVYPGTHDNDTTRGWYARLKPSVQHQGGVIFE